MRPLNPPDVIVFAHPGLIGAGAGGGGGGGGARASVSSNRNSRAVPWYKNPCVTGALSRGAAALGIDAIGFFPGGRALTAGIEGRALATSIGRLGGYSGIVATQQGAKAVVTGRGAVAILGSVGALGDHSGLGAVSAALGLASIIPGVNEIATPAAMFTDGVRAYMDARDCY